MVVMRVQVQVAPQEDEMMMRGIHGRRAGMRRRVTLRQGRAGITRKRSWGSRPLRRRRSHMVGQREGVTILVGVRGGGRRNGGMGRALGV
jgi:hypothetical protein